MTTGQIVGEIDDPQMRHESLAGPREGIDAFISTPTRGAAMTKATKHDSPEFLLVLAGRMRVSYGDAALEMSHGDALVVRPRTPRGLRALGDRSARFLSVHQKETP